MSKKIKGNKYIKMLPRGVVRPYMLPARGLVIEEFFGVYTLLIEEILLFPEMLAFMCVTDGFIYESIRFKFAPKVFGVRAPIIKSSLSSLLKDTKSEEVRFVRNSLLDIKIGNGF